MSARSQAIQTGARTYNTGVPCRMGHVADQYTSNSECMECVKAKNAKHYNDNKQSHADRNSRWKRENKARNAANSNRRRLAQLRATPAWVTAEDERSIWLMYDIASALGVVHGQPFHVDHVVPIQGKTVCGLHVPGNLRVVPATVNRKKYNKFDQ